MTATPACSAQSVPWYPCRFTPESWRNPTCWTGVYPAAAHLVDGNGRGVGLAGLDSYGSTLHGQAGEIVRGVVHPVGGDAVVAVPKLLLKSALVIHRPGWTQMPRWRAPGPAPPSARRIAVIEGVEGARRSLRPFILVARSLPELVQLLSSPTEISGIFSRMRLICSSWKEMNTTRSSIPQSLIT